MNKITMLLLVAVCLLAACSLQDTPPLPQDVARTQMDAYCEKMGADTSGLTFTLVEQTDTSATVQVAGTVSVDHTLTLALEKGRWVLAKPGKEHQPSKDAATQH
jgi:nitrous oxide reductase accessory protein NosL